MKTVLSKLPPVTMRRWKVLLLPVSIYLVVLIYRQTPYQEYFDNMVSPQFLPCKLPKLDPWDPSLLQYIRQAPSPKCNSNPQLLFVDPRGYMQFNISTFKFYQVSSPNCVYSVIVRTNADKDVTFQPEVNFDPPFFIPARYFRVTCRDSSKKVVYDFPHFNVQWNESQTRETEIGKEDDNNYSFFFIGLDSVSHSQARRFLPKSYDYLQTTLHAYDFNGYMRVGYDTYPNLVALLTGRSQYSFPSAIVLQFIRHLDFLPFIWKEEWMKSYVSLFAEDYPHISTMNYDKQGFLKEPSDYFYRPYTLSMDKFKPVLVETFNSRGDHPCYGTIPQFSIQTDLFKGFVDKYRTRLRYAFVWNNLLAHNHLTDLQHGDDTLLELLQWLKSNNHLDRAVLIVLGDHGYRQGGLASTYVGRLETNLPFLNIVLPDKLKQKFPWIHQNIRVNSGRLITAFDVYQTVADIVNGKFARDGPDISMTHTRRNLLSSIPATRSCVDAGVLAPVCICHDYVSVDLNSDFVTKLAEIAVKEINTLLRDNKDICNAIVLKNVSDAKVMHKAGPDRDKLYYEPNNDENFVDKILNRNQFKSGRYFISFYTSPGDALFEAMIDFELLDFNGFRNKMDIIGRPSRINRYGNQSHCMRTSKLLREFCYCIDLLT